MIAQIVLRPHRYSPTRSLTYAAIVRPVGGGIALLLTKYHGCVLIGRIAGRWQIIRSGTFA